MNQDTSAAITMNSGTDTFITTYMALVLDVKFTGGNAGGGDGPCNEGSSNGSSNGNTDGTSDGSNDGSNDGTSDGTSDGSNDGISDGTSDGSNDGISDGTSDGVTEGTVKEPAKTAPAASTQTARRCTGANLEPASKIVQRLATAPTKATSATATGNACLQQMTMVPLFPRAGVTANRTKFRGPIFTLP